MNTPNEYHKWILYESVDYVPSLGNPFILLRGHKLPATHSTSDLYCHIGTSVVRVWTKQLTRRVRVVGMETALHTPPWRRQLNA